MLKIPLTLVLSLSLLSPFKWYFNTFKTGASQVEKASASVVRITGHKIVEDESKEFGCTGFVVAPKRVLTAAHCLSEDILLDGVKPTKLIFKDDYFDLAIFDTEDMGRAPLAIRGYEASNNEELTAIGYGFGWDRLLTLAEIVRNTNYPITDGVPSGLIVQGGYIGGMSGGPVIDAFGQVVSICQRSNQFIGYGVGTTMLRAFLWDAKSRDSYPSPLEELVPGAFLKASRVDLTISPRITLSVPATLRATITTLPDPDARTLCLTWDSLDGEYGSHCFPHVGEDAPKTTVWDFTIQKSGEYAIVATLGTLQGAVNSITRIVKIGVN